MNRVYLVLAFCALLGAAGCDLLREDRPEEATLLLEGASEVEISLITSTNYLSQQVAITDSLTGQVIGDSLLVVLLEADTMVITLPFERIYDIREREQFYAAISRLDPEGDQLRSRIWIDEDLRLDASPPAEQNPLIFSYSFRGSPDGGPELTF